MTSCELCGKPATTKARIEGVPLTVCAACAALGTPFVVPPPVVRAAPKSLKAELSPRELVTDFRQRIRAARQKKGLTEEDAAKALNIHKSTLLHYESGKMHPDDTTAKKFERFYDIVLFEDV